MHAMPTKLISLFVYVNVYINILLKKKGMKSTNWRKVLWTETFVIHCLNNFDARDTADSNGVTQYITCNLLTQHFECLDNKRPKSM